MAGLVEKLGRLFQRHLGVDRLCKNGGAPAAECAMLDRHRSVRIA